MLLSAVCLLASASIIHGGTVYGPASWSHDGSSYDSGNLVLPVNGRAAPARRRPMMMRSVGGGGGCQSSGCGRNVPIIEVPALIKKKTKLRHESYIKMLPDQPLQSEPMQISVRTDMALPEVRVFDGDITESRGPLRSSFGGRRRRLRGFVNIPGDGGIVNLPSRPGDWDDVEPSPPHGPGDIVNLPSRPGDWDDVEPSPPHGPGDIVNLPSRPGDWDNVEPSPPHGMNSYVRSLRSPVGRGRGRPSSGMRSAFFDELPSAGYRHTGGRKASSSGSNNENDDIESSFSHGPTSTWTSKRSRGKSSTFSKSLDETWDNAGIIDGSGGGGGDGGVEDIVGDVIDGGNGIIPSLPGDGDIVNIPSIPGDGDIVNIPSIPGDGDIVNIPGPRPGDGDVVNIPSRPETLPWPPPGGENYPWPPPGGENYPWPPPGSENYPWPPPGGDVGNRPLPSRPGEGSSGDLLPGQDGYVPDHHPGGAHIPSGPGRGRGFGFGFGKSFGFGFGFGKGSPLSSAVGRGGPVNPKGDGLVNPIGLNGADVNAGADGYDVGSGNLISGTNDGKRYGSTGIIRGPEAIGGGGHAPAPYGIGGPGGVHGPNGLGGPGGMTGVVYGGPYGVGGVLGPDDAQLNMNSMDGYGLGDGYQAASAVNSLETQYSMGSGNAPIVFVDDPMVIIQDKPDPPTTTLKPTTTLPPTTTPADLTIPVDVTWTSGTTVGNPGGGDN